MIRTLVARVVFATAPAVRVDRFGRRTDPAAPWAGEFSNETFWRIFTADEARELEAGRVVEVPAGRAGNLNAIRYIDAVQAAKVAGL